MREEILLEEEEKEQLRAFQNRIHAIREDLFDWKWHRGVKGAEDIPEILGVQRALLRAKDKLMYLTELDVVDNDA